MLMQGGNTFTGNASKVYTGTASSIQIDDPDVRQALQNGWTETAGQTSGTAVQVFTTGASGTATAGVSALTVILDGVGTTFALTFPTAFTDTQVIRVLSSTAVSVAFSVTGSGDGSTVKTVPATTAAGSGVAWQYRLANTTWYRLY
jgi:hypothetical protein